MRSSSSSRLPGCAAALGEDWKALRERCDDETGADLFVHRNLYSTLFTPCKSAYYFVYLRAGSRCLKDCLNKSPIAKLVC
jgi:hypothetical protein